MRTLNFFALVGVLLVCIFSKPSYGAKINQQISNQKSNYVVIGAFAIHRNAINFTSHAKELNFNAQFEINKNRNLYYVYVLDTEDRGQAIEEARRIRNETEFKDAWVYGGLLGSELLGEDINPITQQKIDEVPSETSSLLPTVMPSESGVETPKEEKPVEDDATLGTKFLFNLYRANDGEKVEGDVDVIDVDRSRKMASYKGNEPVRVSSPNNNSGAISLVCEVFGYRKVQRDVNYKNPEGEGIARDDDNNVVVPFELTRLQKGDIAIMYNVYFYKDAGVMRPESRYEVNSLLEMLKENTKYKIKIHGHTNGSAPGKIISMGPSKNFFSLNDTKEGFGSAKKLSLERAEVIREYLTNEGIDPKRMQVKAWGGKRPIYEKTSTRAQENVRVEIEILDN
ncbi:MAG TPA: OmpA family protein [Cyclobacteriaceae bacterium]|nr:OmpA family protein [Cyclobacteriaceae bacterium]